MGVILLSASTRTQTTLDHNDSNYPFIALCQVIDTNMLIALSNMSNINFLQ